MSDENRHRAALADADAAPATEAQLARFSLFIPVFIPLTGFLCRYGCDSIMLARRM
jgi:hypothetical protein